MGLKEKEEVVVVVVVGLEEVSVVVVVGVGVVLVGFVVIGFSLFLVLVMFLFEFEFLFFLLEVVCGFLFLLCIFEFLFLCFWFWFFWLELFFGFMVFEVLEFLGEDRKKGKLEKLKCCICIVVGSSWEDFSLLEWDVDDFWIFCGDLGNEVNDDILVCVFSCFLFFFKVKVICDKCIGKIKGYGFVSFKDFSDYVCVMCEMNGKYVGLCFIKFCKSMWKDWNLDVVCKK